MKSTTRVLQNWRQTSTTACHQCRLLSCTLLLVVLVSSAWPVCGQVTSGTTPEGGVSSSTTQENSAYREDRNASTPWPPDEGSVQPGTIITATTPPSTTTSSPEVPTSKEDVTTSHEAITSRANSVTKVPSGRQDSTDDVTTSSNEKGDDAGRHNFDDDDDDFDTTVRPGFDVMKNKTFQVTLGVCMSLCGLLVIMLVLMMFYTKYRGWKDRMNVAPTVRTGGQIDTDRQELVT